MAKRAVRSIVAVVLAAAFLLSPLSTRAQSVPFAPCNQVVRLTNASATAVLITHVVGQQTVICGYAISLGLHATTTAQLAWGTGTTCGTGTAAASPLLAFGSAVTGSSLVATFGDGRGPIDVNPTRGTSDFCIVVSGSTPGVDGTVWYFQG